MKSYIKYMVLFIILIGIGMIGINLYSKDNLKETSTDKIIAKTENKNIDEAQQKEDTSKEESKHEVDVNSNDTNNTTNTTTNSTEKETSKGYLNESANDTTNKVTSNNTNPTDLTVSSNRDMNQSEETSTNVSTQIDISNNATTSDITSLSEETNSFYVLEVDPSIYTSRSTTSSSATTSKSTNNQTETTNVIIVEEEKQTSNSNNIQNSTSNRNTPSTNSNSQKNTTPKTETTIQKTTTTNNLSNLEESTSYKKITILDTITSKDLTKKVSVVGNNGSGIAQSFCVAENYFVTAQINSSNTRTLIQVYNKKTGKKENSIVSNFHHANGMTYNKKNNSIYLVHNNNSKYSVFSSNNIETTKSLNATTKNFPKSISGIAYDEVTNQYYAAKGNEVYVYDSNLKLIRTIRKLRAGTPQDIGAYKGIILVIVFQPNNSTANNAIDLYRASDGAYLGTYNLKFSNMELESIDYYGSGNTFSLYFNAQGKSTDYIYNTDKINLK